MITTEGKILLSIAATLALTFPIVFTVLFIRFDKRMRDLEEDKEKKK